MLSSLFAGAVTKHLTLVETITARSNQHEFQGVQALRQMLGEEDRRGIPTRFIWLSDQEGVLSESGFLSWSNVRKGKPRAPEYHLYYPTNAVTEAMRAGDLLLIALHRDGTLLAIIARDETSQNQLLWLFGLEPPAGKGFAVRAIDGSHDPELGFAARYILDELGVEPPEPEADSLDTLIERFGLVFPSTRVFSELARSSIPKVSAADDPDVALTMWMDQEEKLFRRLERRIVANRIGNGFVQGDQVDVDGFLSFSLSVQNRRKSRVGHALENHLEAVFSAQGVRYVRGAETENRNKPDFLFPGQAEYRDAGFPSDKLAMLGAKSSLKDRWRQVLSEAERIELKHLLTLEPGVSENQTAEMAAKSLQLVLPSSLHSSYRPAQQAWLLSVAQFLEAIKTKQA
jgi:hypothetical protein